jgi:hypothetical protein
LLNKLIGLVLYACEGSKKYTTCNNKIIENRIEFCNCNPKLIELFMHFIRTYDIDESKLRIRVSLHDGDDEEMAKKYWSAITKIPWAQFIKTSWKPSSNKRHNLHSLGLLTIRYNSKELFSEIMKDVELLLYG